MYPQKHYSVGSKDIFISAESLLLFENIDLSGSIQTTGSVKPASSRDRKVPEGNNGHGKGRLTGREQRAGQGKNNWKGTALLRGKYKNRIINGTAPTQNISNRRHDLKLYPQRRTAR